MANIPVNMTFTARGLEAIKGAFNNLIEPAAVFATTGSKAGAAWAGIKTILITKVLGPLSLLSGAVAGVIGGFKLLFGQSQLLAKGMEQVRDMQYTTTQFAPLLNGIENARKHVEKLYKFAAETPFQIGDIAGASKQLEILTRGALGGAENLKLIADAAAVSGQGMQSVGMWVARLYDGLQSGRPVGEAMARLQEMGLVTGLTRKKIEEGTAAGKSFTEMWELMEKEFSRNEGASQKLSQTLGGLESTLIDVKAKFEGQFAENFLEGEMEATKRSILMFQTMEKPVSRIGFWFSKVSNAWEKFKTGLLSGFGAFEGAGNGIGKLVDMFVVLSAAIMAAQFATAITGTSQLAASSVRAAMASQFHGLMEIYRTAGLRAATAAFFQLSFAAKISTIAQALFNGVTWAGTKVLGIFTGAIRSAWAAMVAHPAIALIAALTALIAILYRHSEALAEATKNSNDMADGAKKSTDALREEADAVSTLEGKLALIQKSMTKVAEAQEQLSKIKVANLGVEHEGFGAGKSGFMDSMTGGLWNKTERDAGQIEQAGAENAYQMQLDAAREILNISESDIALNSTKVAQMEEQVKLAQKLKDIQFGRNMEEASAAGKILLLEGKKQELARRIADIEKTRSSQANMGEQTKKSQIDEQRAKLERLAKGTQVEEMKAGDVQDQEAGANIVGRGLKKVFIDWNPILNGVTFMTDLVGATDDAQSGFKEFADDEMFGHVEQALADSAAATKAFEDTLNDVEKRDLNNIRSALEDTFGLLTDLNLENGKMTMESLENVSLETLTSALQSGRIYAEDAAEAIRDLREPASLLETLGSQIENVDFNDANLTAIDDLSDPIKETIAQLGELGLTFDNLGAVASLQTTIDKTSELSTALSELGVDSNQLELTDFQDAIADIKKETTVSKFVERTVTPEDLGVGGAAHGKGLEVGDKFAVEEEVKTGESAAGTFKELNNEQKSMVKQRITQLILERKQYAELTKQAAELENQQAELLENLQMTVKMRELDIALQDKLLQLGIRTWEIEKKKNEATMEQLKAKEKLLETDMKNRDETHSKEEIGRKLALAEEAKGGDLSTEKAFKDNAKALKTKDSKGGDRDFTEEEINQAWKDRQKAWEETQTDSAVGKRMRKVDKVDEAMGIQGVDGKVATGAAFATLDDQEKYIALTKELANAADLSDKELEKVKDQIKNLNHTMEENIIKIKRIVAQHKHLINMAKMDLSIDISMRDDQFGDAHDAMQEMNSLEEENIQLLRTRQLLSQGIAKDVAEGIVQAEALQRIDEKRNNITKMLKSANKAQETSALAMQARGGDQDARKKLEAIENKDFFKDQLKAGVEAGMGKEENIQQAQQLLNAKLMDEVGETKIVADSMRKIGAGGYADSTDPMKRLAEKQLAAQQAVLPILRDMLKAQQAPAQPAQLQP
jgi:hypothetical protein